MAPITRNRKKQTCSPLTEPLATSTPLNPQAAPRSETKVNGHVRFSNDDDDDEDIEEGGASIAQYTLLPVGHSKSQPENVIFSEHEESDDEAPEAVTMNSGKELARKKEEDAKKAIEAQTKAAGQKRKRIDAVRKEQKEKAENRKRQKIQPNSDAVETSGDQKDPSSLDDKRTVNLKGQLITASNKLPLLLPESLLEDVSCNSPTPRTHNRAEDFNSDGDDYESEGGIGVDNDKAKLKKKEKNRKRRQAKKAKLEFKKGPVTVKVFKGDTKARKIMAPPVVKKVDMTKSSWLNGRGGIKRKHVAVGFAQQIFT